ncbi:MAG: DUF4301 family protein, partial [Paludibacteraceae bacterium]|nr:DUF4301 family protein [Paludibacteraceae bacterium]
HKPKGALLFHRYENGHPHTPIEEHLIEAAEYACNNDRHCPLHFTVSPQHRLNGNTKCKCANFFVTLQDYKYSIYEHTKV